MSRRRTTLFYLNFTLSEESYCISDWVWSSSSLNVEICLQVILNPKYSSPNSFNPPGLISILVSVPEHSLLGATFNHCHIFLQLKTDLNNLKLFYRKIPRLSTKDWDFRDDCTELILSVSLYSWFSATVNFFFSSPNHQITTYKAEDLI